MSPKLFQLVCKGRDVGKFVLKNAYHSKFGVKQITNQRFSNFSTSSQSTPDNVICESKSSSNNTNINEISTTEMKGYIGRINCQGRKHGRGKYIFENGDVYEGDFHDDLLQGEGMYTSVDGNTYIGSFHANQFQGVGTLTYSNGDTYEGHFDEGLQNGHGKYTTKSTGEVLEGTFDRGVYFDSLMVD